ncbi:MAG: flavin monoamine oxidase family protein [Phenylobacterium sp.]|uniref:flavin monoamine oxidase family protein n=1 Tax=Phenylobacterium sp. TaxID=1871053 RepID=UPI00391B346A
MAISRRLFLHRVGAAGGSGAAFAAMRVMGLAGVAAAAAGPALGADAGRGRSVAILGGGIAGLVCAYELERAGFKVTLLEARDRLGGRNWTLRNGSKVEMVGEATQTVAFSEGLYMNAGPARIPSHHDGLLSYCRKLGVPLEVEINSSRSAYLLAEGSGGGKPVQMRQGVNDTRGHISELLAKAIRKGALDEELTAEDREKLLPFLRFYGDLDADMAFKGTERSGLLQVPGAADQFAMPRPPLPLRDLLANPQLPAILFEDNINMQATMFQPVGGMDRVVDGFERAIESPIVRNAEIVQIRARDGGVAVAWKDRASGAKNTLTADYAVITIPLALLAKLDTNFDTPVKRAIAAVPNDYSNKIGFDAPRFWERQQIYGGISFVGGETNLVWYPSNDLGAERGMLLACYGSGPPAEAFARRTLAEQAAIARGVVGRLHPGHEASLEKPVVVNWSKVPFNMGPWPRWPGSRGGQEGHFESPEYMLLNQPHGRVHFAGAHLSQTPGWQEGAIFSAQRAIAALTAQVREHALAAA